jgi:hypothetical protein
MNDGSIYYPQRAKGYTVRRTYIIDCIKCGEAVNPDDDKTRYFLADANREIDEHEKVFHSAG